ncbi:MAG: polysaccharide deacetylase family protein [Spiribacter salinus]|uniref:Polysaccharide deacetylase family protein n=1 Tax=Spiribacter salinus TaxID=1335746 RepID=A0A540VTM8_9GAMM|nr:MAG: polysaccharide deacetylase family protein [Spiribacter salinus]
MRTQTFSPRTKPESTRRFGWPRAASGAARRRLSILIYHRVLADADPLQPDAPSASRFARHMRWLGRMCNVLPLGEAVSRLRNGTLPLRAVAVTFDDGYADNYEVARPIMARYGIPWTLFVATGFLYGGRMWNDTVIEAVRRWPARELDWPEIGLQRLPLADDADRLAAIRQVIAALKYRPLGERQALASDLAARTAATLPQPMMRDAEVKALHREGVTIGGHTRNHPILTALTEEEAEAEIRNGKADLEALLDAPINLFAYPNGVPDQDFHAGHARLVRKLGFVAAVTTAWGTGGPDADLYQLPRFTPWDRGSARFLLRLAHHRARAGEGRRASPANGVAA